MINIGLVRISNFLLTLEKQQEIVGIFRHFQVEMGRYLRALRLRNSLFVSVGDLSLHSKAGIFIGEG